MIYSLASSERIDTWLVYTIRLRALGRRACIWHIVQCHNIVHATSKGPLGARPLYEIHVSHVPISSFCSDTSSFLCTDSRGAPRTITNSKGRKRRPGTKDLSYAIKTTDVAFLDFIRQCLEWDPALRLTPEQGLQHEWILSVSRRGRGGGGEGGGGEGGLYTWFVDIHCLYTSGTVSHVL